MNTTELRAALAEIAQEQARVVARVPNLPMTCEELSYHLRPLATDLLRIVPRLLDVYEVAQMLEFTTRGFDGGVTRQRLDALWKALDAVEANEP